MWNYEKRLQYPVNITTPNAKLASVIISQYGGPDGEMGASMRYLSQRYTMPYKQGQAVLTDIGSEASEMEFSEASAFFSVSKAPVTPFATVKLHLCGSIFK
ncbi:MAG: spore coat protein CotJC [Lachnospiraceae bacterium]|nr:spore coat protein CotJC [Lachnospiraceae bacterium]